MASTFIEFHNNGFEASDAIVEVWLHLLIREIEKIANPPAWLLEIRNEWQTTSTAGFGFGVDPDLDRLVASEEKRKTIVALSQSALKVLDDYGETISKDTLNAMQTGGEGNFFTQDVPTRKFKTLAHYFNNLLDGRLAPTEVDSRF